MKIVHASSKHREYPRKLLCSEIEQRRNASSGLRMQIQRHFESY
nr:MAG TPA: hypothetical protein [Caudoviricetes sp.]